jgi:hypothetical protein
MTKQWHGVKGSKQRSGNDEAYRSNWDRIFGGIDYNTVDITVKDLKEKVDTVDDDDKKT